MHDLFKTFFGALSGPSHCHCTLSHTAPAKPKSKGIKEAEDALRKAHGYDADDLLMDPNPPYEQSFESGQTISIVMVLQHV